MQVCQPHELSATSISVFVIFVFNAFPDHQLIPNVPEALSYELQLTFLFKTEMSEKIGNLQNRCKLNCENCLE